MFDRIFPKGTVNATQSADVTDQRITRPETQSRKRIGYARVSTEDQNLDLQLRALTEAGCDAIYQDTASGTKTDRPGLEDALTQLSAGDTLIVWKLDRLGRSLQHLIQVINDIGARGVDFISLTEALDTTSAGGRLLFNVIGAINEFERDLIAERTRAGLNAARARGVRLGRPVALSERQLEHARRLVDSGEPKAAVARSLNVGRSTLYRALG